MNPSIAQDIEYILDFVERHNKQDKEEAIAQAAQRVESYLATYQPEKDV